MTRRPVGAGWPARSGAAILLALGVLLGGPFTDRARAADDGLRLTTVATYALQADEHRVRVTIDVTATNTVPDVTSGIFTKQTYFVGFEIAIQPESTRARATAAGRSLAVTTTDRRRYDLVEIRFAQPLYYGDTARVRVRYDLPAGKPRSSSEVRVGVAFSTFAAWAFGDSGRVRIEVPAVYEVDTAGSPLAEETASTTTVLTSGPIAAPADWYVIVDARRDEELTNRRLDIPSGEKVVVRGWPEDDAWVDRTGDVLTVGLPVLVGLIGLPWPVGNTLEVIEIHTPLLEGYAGFYDPDTDTITVSEDLDGQTILHEASHAWFNGDLFDERWIAEGLADVYAARTLQEVDGTTSEPRSVSRDEAAAFPLSTWLPPRPIRGEATASYEEYGYAASWFVMNELVDLAGPDAMRDVLRAAAADEIAYVGEGRPEHNPFRSDWRWLLDLTEERARVEVAGVFREWIAESSDEADLDARTLARDAYADLVVDGAGWQPPLAVRGPLTRWRFDAAMAQIEAARQVLAARDEIAARATALRVDVPPGLEAEYETQAADVGVAMTGARVRLDALSELQSASQAVAAPRDALAELGLLAEPAPEVRLDEAKDAFEDGEFALVAERSDAVRVSLAAAPEVGRTRVIAGAAGVLVVLVAGSAGVLAIRRARRGSPRSAIAATAALAPLATLPPTPPGDVSDMSPTEPANEGGDEANA